MVAAGLLVSALVVVGMVVLLRELAMIIGSAQNVSYDPVPMGENYCCPTCKAFWYQRDEEVHFKGCIAPIVRGVKDEAKFRSEPHRR